MKIELVRGAEAARLAEEPAFQAAWRALVADQPQFALLQAPEFVLPWYQAYAGLWEPLLVLGRDGDGTLAGLLPLARRVADGRLAHAGAEQAEYHGWLVRPGRDEELLVPALERLARELPLRAWSWRWLPPGAATGWLGARALAAAGLHVLSEARPAPVWDLGDAEALARHDNRSLRAKRNRYRRRGELVLERVQDGPRARALLAELAAQCDFRQEAIHGVRPFADDPRKLEFFAQRVARFPAASHFSVLRCGSEALAFHLGGCDGRTCLLGLSSYAPQESKHSPGTLLLVELARALAAEGYRTLDLTPGTDAYKQRYATRQQELVRLRLFGSRTRRLGARLALRARTWLAAGAGGEGLARAERLERWQRGLSGARAALAHGEAGALLAGLSARAFERRTLECFTRAPQAPPPPAGAGTRARLQAFADLTVGANGHASPARRARLAAALARFSDGEVLYTVPVAQELACLGWRAPAPSGDLAEALTAAGWLAQGSELLIVERRVERLAGEPEALAECVAAMLAGREVAAAGATLCLEPPTPDERAALAALGFQSRGRLRRRRVLGRAPVWSARPAQAGGAT
ncbi:MAG TPA: GNAT family N-acetyltransferase [Planctomycetota bacterium]